MLRHYLRLLTISLLASCLLPLCIVICTRLLVNDTLTSPEFLAKAAGTGAVLLTCWAILWFVLRRLTPWLATASQAQADFLDGLADRYVSLAIVVSAGLSLFLELAVIRWQTTVFPLFAFYKNFGLLACFAGLGLGYALADRKHIPLPLTVPVLCFQVGLLVFLRRGLGDLRLRSVMATPIVEQLNMSFGTATGPSNFVAIYLFLAVVFVLTALAFVPVGQICGRLMRRLPNLRAYGLNLLGSLAGIGLMLGLSYLWMPPAVWFLPCFAVMLGFQRTDRRALLGGACVALAAVALLAWPARPEKRIYSPYQMLEYTTEPHLRVNAAGLFYLLAMDLSDEAARATTSPYVKVMKRYYELPYKVYPSAKTVAVLGAGAGNDVAAALRHGAQHVDAIEIDPAIMHLGTLYHPEAPYRSPRVTTVVNDARTFLRNTTETFDVIAYGLVDSYAVLSHASSVRLDSFVYTVEGLRDARARLNDGGLLCLTFAGLTPEMDGKLYAMLMEAFDGQPPVCLRTGSYPSVAFLERKHGPVALPDGLLAEGGYEDVTAACAANSTDVDISTDDWPFFYMPRRVYPVSYLGVLALMAALSFVLIRVFLHDGLRFGSPAFFFMGAGFMLVETKGITELGLAFGNTWQVIGIVIAGVLFMAFLANAVVHRLKIAGLRWPFVLLLLSLALGFAIAKGGGFPPTLAGRAAAVAVLTCPLFFSGIVFSTLLRSGASISGAMAMNLLGAMGGGLLEYNSMYFGFRSLYVLAGALYAAALVAALRPARSYGGR